MLITCVECNTVLLWSTNTSNPMRLGRLAHGEAPQLFLALSACPHSSPGNGNMGKLRLDWLALSVCSAEVA